MRAMPKVIFDIDFRTWDFVGRLASGATISAVTLGGNSRRGDDCVTNQYYATQKSETW